MATEDQIELEILRERFATVARSLDEAQLLVNAFGKQARECTQIIQQLTTERELLRTERDRARQEIVKLKERLSWGFCE